MNVATMLAAVAAASPAAPATTAQAPTAQPAVKHVWTILLENKNFADTFGTQPKSAYLGELPKQGALVQKYYGTGHASLDNYITMVSGAAPNPVTQSDCQVFQEFVGGPVGADGQVVGQGCVYPKEVLTVGDQLKAKGLTYRGYMQDMGADPAREPATCAHPAVNGQDHTQSATAKDQYAARHNPFMYFHSVIDDQAGCDKAIVNLDRLPDDLDAVATTPNYSFITPDLCADGHDAECVNPDQKGGYDGIDAFLREWVPRITGSKAFKQDGLLVITFDEAASDDTACCDEPTGPNTPMPGINGPGGGQIGAVLLSPRIKPGTVITEPMNHYGYLRSVEDLFGLKHLGYAAQDVNKTFQATGVFNNPAVSTTTTAPARPVSRFKVTRKGRRLTIRVKLAAGVVGKLTVKRHGKVVKRYKTGASATLRLKGKRPAKVTLRATRRGKTVKRLSRRK